jgi:hypothetical protein
MSGISSKPSVISETLLTALSLFLTAKNNIGISLMVDPKAAETVADQDKHTGRQLPE